MPILFSLFSLVAGCTNVVPPEIIQGSKIVVANQLLGTVSVKVNGISVGEVSGQEVEVIQRGDLDYVEVEWELLRPTLNGVSLGDSLGGIFMVDIPGDDDSLYLPIDNVILTAAGDEEVYMAPLIENATSAPMVVGVNMGLGSNREYRPDVELEGGASLGFIGYYRIDSGSNVRVYNPAYAYGPFLFIERLYERDFNRGDLELGSGRLSLIFDKPPHARQADQAND
ncbi:MAG: hypothetical protein AB7H80_13625 [Candidatus Kapaibacterium sp.]